MGAINPSANILIAAITYDPATPVEIENTGGVDLGFGLANSGMATGPVWTVNPGITHNTTLGAMGPSGNELRGQNNTPSAGSYRITIG